MSAVAVSLKKNPAPGSNRAISEGVIVPEFVPKIGTESLRMILVMATLPVLVMVPVKVSVPPGVGGEAGQALVKANAGVVEIGQIWVAEELTEEPQIEIA